MRSVRHPGPVAAVRSVVVPCRAERVRLHLEPYRSVNQAVAEAFARAGAPGGYVRLAGAAVSPMRFVIPAPATSDGSHAAWYSDLIEPTGVTVMEDAGLVVGHRDGEPFLHCHGLWRLAEGERRMGHLLPLDSMLAEPAEAEAWAVSGAVFDVVDNPETAFRLFRPSPCAGPTGGGKPALLCAFGPNQDIVEAVETACRAHGFQEASVHGIGSLIGAEFENGGKMSSYATEVMVRQGSVDRGRAALDVAMVGLKAEIGEGRLIRGVNPVCVTFEVLVVAR